MRLFIAIPSCRDWKDAFGISLANLGVFLTHMSYDKTSPLDEFIIRPRGGSLLSMTRELLFADAREADATHILWVDDDTWFETQAIQSLLSHQDKDFVAANICRKMLPTSFTALGLDGQQHDSRDKTGLSKVAKVGLGLTLTSMDSLKKIGVPHFNIGWSDKYKAYVGEDVFLCEKLKQHGYNIFVDNDASKHVAHVGDFAYSYQHIVTSRAS